MHALDKKLLRDFKRLWGQSLAIALVLACGVMILLTAFGMYRALDDTLEAFYERNEFADVWAATEKAPRPLLREIAALDGVQRAEARVQEYLMLDLPGRVKSATGLALSLPDNGALPGLNVPLLRSGRLPDPQATDEVLVTEPFAQANGFVLGDTFDALLSGQKRSLKITGTALSPEFVYAIGPGTLMPDDTSFGVMWLPQAMLASAFDMSGAFNSVSLSLTRGANEPQVIDALDDLLAPYGGTGAHGRDQQASNAFIATEIKQLKNMATILPPVFFGISAFLVNMVIGRIIALERGEIGLLKALGYTDLHIAAHYVLLAGLTALLGIVIGWITGGMSARWMAAEYAQYFKFPYLIFNVSYDAYAISGFLALLTAAIGALRSAMAAATLPPAVAMSPPAPPRFKRSLFDRLLAALRLSQPSMMIWRSLFRWPLRAAMSAVGLSLAVAIMISVGFFSYSINAVSDIAFDQSNREDTVLLFAKERSLSALEDVRKLPGVEEVEGELYTPVKLRNGWREKQLSIITRGEGATLARSIDEVGHVVEANGSGLLITTRVAEVLGLRPGDQVEVEFMTGRRETYWLTVSGITEQFLGLGAYMSREAMARLTRTEPQISVANVSLDPRQDMAFNTAIKEVPMISGAVRVTDMKASFAATVDENISIMNGLFSIVAILITVGLTYNSARIQLSERARELASLRILGFSNWEVSFVLVGEIMLIAALAQPLGWLIGYGLGELMAASFSSDLYSIPMVLPPAAYARASLVVLATSFVSVMLVRRRIDRLDLVSVMKTRE
ncbi:ABC transporter permease [Celeribacter neptunius]|uniref:Putative ABC transport system permease protein n=1 Tax=Celeribacter neptunius TaxID=588602 RepID=A0A1I3VDP9_9RHOB|nr:ABC transporter permease [Celeribacter neptunius]SFJ92337.1 putative ABC transport system permease protein [Celeribacter neptunius]